MRCSSLLVKKQSSLPSSPATWSLCVSTPGRVLRQQLLPLLLPLLLSRATWSLSFAFSSDLVAVCVCVCVFEILPQTDRCDHCCYHCCHHCCHHCCYHCCFLERLGRYHSLSRVT